MNCANVGSRARVSWPHAGQYSPGASLPQLRQRGGAVATAGIELSGSCGNVDLLRSAKPERARIITERSLALTSSAAEHLVDARENAAQDAHFLAFQSGAREQPAQ